MEPLYSRLRASLEVSGRDCFEIVFVDDGSTDGTIEIIKRLSEEDGRVKLVVRSGERGLASAILRGIFEAGSSYIVVMDADLQHPPEKVPELLEALEKGYDIVVASRYARGGGVEGWSRLRLIISLGASVLAWILVPETRRTSDPMSGFFALNRERVKLPQKPPPGFKLLLEVLRLNPQARVAEVPYIFGSRLGGRSKLGFNAIIDYLIHLAMASTPLRFAAVGFTGTIINLLVFYAFLSFGAPLDAAILAGFEAGLLSNFVLHEKFTFSHRSYGGSAISRLAKYHVSSAAGIGVGFIVSRTLTTVMGLDPLLSQLLGVIAGFTANYLLSSRGVWAQKSG